MMHDIYYRAKESLIYLGESDEDIRSAFDFGQTFAFYKDKCVDEVPQLPYDESYKQSQTNWPLLLPNVPVDIAMKQKNPSRSIC